MMDRFARAVITLKASEIREELIGIRLFGEPLDMDNIDALIVAVYALNDPMTSWFREQACQYRCRVKAETIS